MLLATTSTLDGRRVDDYLGIVSGDAILGANVVRDFLARITDIVGGRSGTYERALRKAKQIALDEMAEEAGKLGADAIIGIDLDYETIGDSMLMVSASGTAVRLAR